MTKKLIIKEDLEVTVLKVTLADILKCISEPDFYKWKILWFEGIWNLDESILDFEDTINNSENGVSYNFTDLLILSNNINQIMEIILVGDKDMDKLVRYQEDVEMYENCEMVLELVDSSYWEINTSNAKFSDNLIKSFENVEVVTQNKG
ncbi:hypothetical protein [Flavobacterium sp. 25HG05S-40]|uniref:hypothetical protein n=1 Tax=Flavobacterium sp. 25HG05S-40 TaxID=3458682 RepID=UPI004044B288